MKKELHICKGLIREGIFFSGSFKDFEFFCWKLDDSLEYLFLWKIHFIYAHIAPIYIQVRVLRFYYWFFISRHFDTWCASFKNSHLVQGICYWENFTELQNFIFNGFATSRIIRYCRIFMSLCKVTWLQTLALYCKSPDFLNAMF